MTHRCIRLFQATLFAGALAGCTTASLEDAAPLASVPTPTVKPDIQETAALADTAIAETAKPAGTAGKASDTGAFPNLNVQPAVAAEQLTAEEKAAKIAELEAAKAGQGNKAGASAAELAKLKKLAKTHGSEALKKIEE